MPDFVEDHLEEIGSRVRGGKVIFPRPQDSDVEDALKVMRRVQRVLLRQPGARAIDVGFLVRQGKNQFTDQLAIRLHVDNKLDPVSEGGRLITGLKLEPSTGVRSEVRRDPPEEGEKEGKEYLILYSLHKPNRYYRVDVIEARYLPSSGGTQVSEPRLNSPAFENEELLALGRTRVHPLVGGLSIGNEFGQAGTLGAVVWDRTDGEPCLLSNWHVLAGSPTTTPGARCFQPALLDGGRPGEDLVGRLKRGLFDRHGDAALASIAAGRVYSPSEILGLWVPVAGTVEPKLGMPVRKWGRTTGFTRGFVDGLHFTVNLDYSGVGTRKFENQVHIATRIKGDEVSAPGDSGAVWVTKYEPCDPHLKPGHEQAKAKQLELKPESQPAPWPGIAAADEAPPPEPRVYFAVALNFAGDQPGAHSGEFAVATPLAELARRLEFSFRPVFFPPSSYVLKSTSEPSREATPRPDTGSDGQVVRPGGGQGDPGTSPQPEPRSIPPSG